MSTGADPEFLVVLSVRDDGTATKLWTSGIAISIGHDEASRLAEERIPLTPEAKDWLQVLYEAIPHAVARGSELASLFGIQAMDATVVVGNRGSSDGFGWVPGFIGINVAAFAGTYGAPNRDAVDRMTRIVAHEYLHLLTYAHYPNHVELRRTPIDRALWTMFFEGVGDYVSVSSRWLPNDRGDFSPLASRTLLELEPILVDRLESLVNATEMHEKELRTGISSGRFDKKWGSLPVALWLHSEAQRCGERETMRAVFRLERRSVLALAARHVQPELRARVEMLREQISDERNDSDSDSQSCIGGTGHRVDSR